MSGQKIISGRSGQSSSVEVIKKRIVRIAEICGKELTPALVALWIEHLSEFTAAVLDNVLGQIEKTCHFFPTPGDVRQIIESAKGVALEDQIEKYWQSVLRELMSYTPDLPGGGISKEIPAEVLGAVGAAGGWDALCRMDHEALQWAKKRFADSIRNRRELEAIDPKLLAPAKPLSELLQAAPTDLNAAIKKAQS